MDKFERKNREFVQSYPCKRVCTDMSKQTTVLSPIITSIKTKEIWIKLTQKFIGQFYLKRITRRFNFMTWNVGSKEPKHQESILDDLAKIFRVPYTADDFVVIALEEMDISVPILVDGRSIFQKHVQNMEPKRLKY